MKKIFISLLSLTTFIFTSFAQTNEFDVIIKNGTIYDGNPEQDDAPGQVYTLRDLDGTDDAADWITAGHVLDAQEADWLRSLRVVTP